MASFLGEIKRRKVFQVAAVYLVVAWLLVQIVATVETPLSLPDWADTLVIVLLAVGFPVAVILSWAFDITPDGLVRDSVGRVQDGGRRIEYALIVLLLVAVGWIVYRIEFAPPTAITSAAADVLPNSVAVLPFENLSPDPENEYFADGIHDEILGQLAKIRALNVISRTSVLQYADATDLEIPEIARNLNVQAVMEGTVRFADGRVRISVQLIDGATDQHLWAEVYQRPLADIFAIQADIARQIAVALETELLPSEQAIIERRQTVNPDAITAYLRAVSLISGYLGPGLNLRIDEFDRSIEEALQLDPAFARAHALKAVRYATVLAEPRPLNGPTYAELEETAVRHATRAIELDATEGLAYNALAQVDEIHWRGAQAEMRHERALALSPNDPDVLNDFSSFYLRTGRPDDAIRLADQLVDIDPVAGPGWMGFVQMMTGNYSEAIRYARLGIARGDPRTAMLRQSIAYSTMRLGDNDAAIEQLSLLDDDAPPRLAFIYGFLGLSDDFERARSELERLAETQYVGPGTWAMLALSVGDFDEALSQLNRAAENRGPGDGADFLHQIAHNLIGEPALERPEFVDVRERLRFQEWPIVPRSSNR